MVAGPVDKEMICLWDLEAFIKDIGDAVVLYQADTINVVGISFFGFKNDVGNLLNVFRVVLKIWQGVLEIGTSVYEINRVDVVINLIC